MRAALAPTLRFYFVVLREKQFEASEFNSVTFDTELYGVELYETVASKRQT